MKLFLASLLQLSSVLLDFYKFCLLGVFLFFP